MIVTEDEVQRIYRKRFPSEELAAKSRMWKIIVQNFFARWIKPTDTVLDLGCGYGEFLNHVNVARRIGVDLNPDSPRHLDSQVDFFQKSVCDLNFIEDNSVDFVFTSNLMEHLPGKREVEQMVREAFRVLRPGGHFVMMGPNIRFLPGDYWDFWDHVVAISDRSLRELLENVDFEIADLYPKFLPYTTRSSVPQHPLLIKMYLNCPPMWRVMGKQFLIRARKPIEHGGVATGALPKNTGVRNNDEPIHASPHRIRLLSTRPAESSVAILTRSSPFGLFFSAHCPCSWRFF